MDLRQKTELLKDIFGIEDIRLESNALFAGSRKYPVLDDVIILLEPSQYPDSVVRRLKVMPDRGQAPGQFAQDIQFTFGEEWRMFSAMMPEHEAEFNLYFDIIDQESLKDKRVCDLGCGIGRWSYFLQDKCRELILVDFSDAIFEARKNLKNVSNVLFFMGDLKRLPLRSDFCDFLFCLGVLHHLPANALAEVRALGSFAPKLLIYLYYALDNKPVFYRALLGMVTGLRMILSKVRSPLLRSWFTFWATALIYEPFIGLGYILPKSLSSRVPLYEGNRGKSFKRIKQDVYDRFFTRIEQRFRKVDILGLKDTFADVVVSENIPYWHFYCSRKEALSRPRGGQFSYRENIEEKI